VFCGVIVTPPPALQVFHRTPAYEDGTLCPGDELMTVNGVGLKGLSRKQAADIIQGEKVRQAREGTGRGGGKEERKEQVEWKKGREEGRRGGRRKGRRREEERGGKKGGGMGRE
jgi:hypothetical protein